MRKANAARWSLRSGPSGPAFNDYRAGSATIASGTNQVTVTFSSALPSASYAAQLTISPAPAGAFAANAGCSGNNNDCYFFSVAAKTTTGFTIQLRQGLNGAQVNAGPQSVTVDYVAILNK